MLKTEFKKFVRWAKEEEKGKGLLGHFYIKRKTERYEPPDFFILNMLSKDKEIFMKGTTGHGVKDNRGKPSETPCLNFYEVDDRFYKAMKEYYRNRGKFPLNYTYAIILDKRKMGERFLLIEVKSRWKATERIGPRNCHYYDDPRFRRVLRPFNNCGITRAEVKPDKIIKKPFARIPTNLLIGILTPKKEKRIFRDLLKKKGLNKVEVFALCDFK